MVLQSEAWALLRRLQWRLVFRLKCCLTTYSCRRLTNFGQRPCTGLAKHLITTACSANPDSKSPYEMWFGEALPAKPYPFLKPAYCRRQRPSKMLPKGESCFYVRPSRDHPCDCHRVLTRAGTIQETRDVTWEAPPSHIPPPQPLLPI